MKQLEINRKLESDVEHAEKAFMVRYETTASAQDHDTLRVLENQISDLQTEIAVYEKNNGDVEEQIRQLIQQLSTATGTQLNDSIDQDFDSDSYKGGGGSKYRSGSQSSVKQGPIGKLIAAKSEALITQRKKMDIQKELQKEFAFDNDDDFY